jgi:hypothetical protein
VVLEKLVTGSPGLLSKLQHAAQLTCAKSDAWAICPLMIKHFNAKCPTNGGFIWKIRL